MIEGEKIVMCKVVPPVANLTKYKTYLVKNISNERYLTVDDNNQSIEIFKSWFVDIVPQPSISGQILCVVDNEQPREQDILSPSQPNMRVGGRVKCILDTDLFEVGKDYEIVKTYVDSYGSYCFDVKDSSTKIRKGYGALKAKFSSCYFDCDNALPYNSDNKAVDVDKDIEALSKIIAAQDIKAIKQLSPFDDNNFELRLRLNKHRVSEEDYVSGECLDVIKAQLGKNCYIAFLRGQIRKYNSHLIYKNTLLESAKKIQYYTSKLIEELEGCNDE